MIPFLTYPLALITQLPGLVECNGRSGTEMILKTTGDSVVVTQPDGTRKTFAKTADQLSLETPLPGLYSVIMGSATNWFAVNPLAAGESDLAPCETGRWGEWKNATERRFQESSLVWMIALAALLVLVSHLSLSVSGKGRA